MGITLRVGIGSPDEFARMRKVAEDDPALPLPEEPEVWFASMAAFARAMTGENASIISAIRDEKPASILNLAERLGKNKATTHAIAKSLEKQGLIKLHRESKYKLRPEVYYDDIQLHIYLA